MFIELSEVAQMNVTLAVFVAIIIALFQERIGPEIVMLAGMMILVAFGVIDLKTALEGFANTGVIMIAALYVVGAGLQATGAIQIISRWMLGKPTQNTSLLRLMSPVAGLSAFMNNTPLVAFLMPAFIQMAKRLRLSPSRFLIPLSYASILGGVCTLIGTSTNMVTDSIIRDKQLPPMSMFELSVVGVPIAIVGLMYMTFVGRRLLPDRQDLLEHIETHRREYTVEMLATAACPLIGQTVRQAGLRELPGLYLYRIERGPETITPVDPQEKLRVGDVLSFSGIASTVVDLQKIRGFAPVDHLDPPSQITSLTDAKTTAATPMSLDSFEGLPPAAPPKAMERIGRQLCEVVISTTSPLRSKTIRETNFRTHYNASILAVHRSGEKLEQKIGKIELQAGDTLLIDANDDFIRRWRHSPDFILVSGVEDSAPVAHERSWVALIIFATVLFGMSFPFGDGTPKAAAQRVVAPPAPAAKLSPRMAPVFLPENTRDRSEGELKSGPAPVVQKPVKAKRPFSSADIPAIVAILGAVAMIFTGCVRGSEALQSIQLQVVLLVGAALGIGKALEVSGAASFIANSILGTVGTTNPVIILAVIYLLTVVLSEFLSNNATAAMMGSLAIATAAQMNVNPRPFLIAVTIAASCAFASPIGYQTNLMVLNAGGYKFMDYVKVGLPLNFLCMIIALIVIPLAWTFELIVAL